jgi:ABC-type Fe3+/spermidine/putrescine transport system ATPase subunit
MSRLPPRQKLLSTRNSRSNIQEAGITFVVVTRGREEAMTLSTRIAVMDRASSSDRHTRRIYEFPRQNL